MSNESKINCDASKGEHVVGAVVGEEGTVKHVFNFPTISKLSCQNGNNVNESGSGSGNGSGNGSENSNNDLSKPFTGDGETTIQKDRQPGFTSKAVETIITNILNIVFKGNEETVKHFINNGKIQNSEVTTIIENSKGPIIELIMDAINHEDTPTPIEAELTIQLYVNKHICDLGAKTAFGTALSGLLSQYNEHIKAFIPTVLGMIFSQKTFTIGKTEFNVERKDLVIKLTSKPENEEPDSDQNKDPNQNENTSQAGTENNVPSPDETNNDKKDEEIIGGGDPDTADAPADNTKDGKNEKKSITATINIGKLQTCINHIIEKDLVDIVKMVINSWVSDENKLCKFNVRKTEFGKGPGIGEWDKKTDAPADAGSDAPAATPPQPPAATPPQPPVDSTAEGGGKKRRKTRKKSSSTRRRKSNRKSRKKRKQTKRKHPKKQTKRKN